MKIDEKVVQELRKVLTEYIMESGERRGKFMFSKDLGIIENELYNEVWEGKSGYDLFDRPDDLTGTTVEEELEAVDDNRLPFLGVI